MTKQAILLLRRVKRHIIKHSRQFDMSEGAQKVRGCGTVCCIAGHVVLSAIGDFDPDDFSAGGNDSPIVPYPRIQGMAAMKLGLSASQAERLFHKMNWPDEYRNKYSAAKTKKEKAAVAARYIEFFIRKYK